MSAGVWLSKNYPISTESFFPLLHVLSFSSKQIAKFKDYLLRYQLPDNSFPLKAKVPLFMTMKATFFLRNLSFDTSEFEEKKLFTVDEEYFEQRMLNFHQPNINLTSPSPNSAA